MFPVGGKIGDKFTSKKIFLYCDKFSTCCGGKGPGTGGGLCQALIGATQGVCTGGGVFVDVGTTMGTTSGSGVIPYRSLSISCSVSLGGSKNRSIKFPAGNRVPFFFSCCCCFFSFLGEGLTTGLTSSSTTGLTGSCTIGFSSTTGVETSRYKKKIGGKKIPSSLGGRMSDSKVKKGEESCLGRLERARNWGW